MVKEPNQIAGSAIVVNDTKKHDLGAVFHEWLVFKSASLSFDRTKFNFTLEAKCSNEKVEVIMSRITYDYDLDRDPKHYTAEEWITDENAVNKDHTKLYPLSAKFRRKTDKIRNILNIIFMIGAVVGVILYLSKNEERHYLGLYIILIAMCFKIAESSMRMIK